MSNPISLSFNQGETVQYPVTIKDNETGNPIDLTSYTVTSDIRKEYNQPVIASFTVNTTNLDIGEFILELDSITSESLPMNTGGRITSFVFDVDLTAGSSVATPITGYLKVQRGVTDNV